MEGSEAIPLIQSPRLQLPDAISILVVDDDTTCLTIVASILKRLKYQVVAVNHPSDALSVLRRKGFAFHLVVTDVHMPDMNGFQLQQTIAQEFNLPVVLMSADDKENTALQGLECGAAYFIVKPVMADDLRDLWQFTAMGKKSTTSQVEIEENPNGNNNNNSNTTYHGWENYVSDETPMASLMNNNADSPISKKDSKKKFPKKDQNGDDRKGENAQSSSQKRPKVIWTNSLHNRFLEAIKSIGLDRAVPKKILEVMNVPGLTRENVASHLQKYRIFLRRVSDASYKIQYSMDKTGSSATRNLGPNFDMSRTNLTSTISLRNPLMTELPSQNPASLAQLYQQYPCPVAPNLTQVFPIPEPSPSNSLRIQSGFGQPCLLSSKGNNWLIPSIGNPSYLESPNYLGNPSGTALLSSIGFDNMVVNPTGINPNPNFEIPSMVGNLVDNKVNVSSMPSKFQSSFVGYSLSSIKRLMESGRLENPSVKDSNSGLLDLPDDNQVIQSNAELVRLPEISTSDIELGMPSQPFQVNQSCGNELLSDVIANYHQILTHGDDNDQGNESHIINQSTSEAFPSFEFPEFDISPHQHQYQLQQPLQELDHLNSTMANQMGIQNQPQQNESESITSSSFYGEANLWDNLVPFFAQAPDQQCSQGFVDFQQFGASSQLINDNVTRPILLEQQQQQQQQQVYKPALPNNPLGFASSSDQHINKTLTLQPNIELQCEEDDLLESLFAPYGDQCTFDGL